VPCATNAPIPSINPRPGVVAHVKFPANLVKRFGLMMMNVTLAATAVVATTIHDPHVFSTCPAAYTVIYGTNIGLDVCDIYLPTCYYCTNM
jgi:hypothetical protein